MALPTITATFRLAAEPELRYTPSGAAVCKLRLAANANRKNEQTGQWEKADELFISGTMFGQQAETLAEANLEKGQEVMVSGRLRTNSWQDQEGNSRSVVEMRLDRVAPTIRPARQSAASGGFGHSGQGDPWATGGFAPQSEEAPF